MTRRLWIVMSSFAVAASMGLSLSSCNTPSCGPGTVQQQQKDGTLKCVVADDLAMNTPCDVDGGNAKIVGGHCVSAIQCDPATTMLINGVCVGNGMSTTPSCSGANDPGKACVSGRILDFKSNMPSSATVQVQLWDPVTLLGGGMPLATQPTATGGYVFKNFTPPVTGLIVVLTGDGTMQVLTGTGAQGIGASTYVVDAYTIPKAQADAWMFDYTTGGAYIAKFYKDAKPPANNLTANEMMPAAGVTLYKDGAPAAGTKYFNDTLTAIDPSLTVTGNSGVAIVASPVTGSFPTFSGMGGGVAMWESLPGGSKGQSGSTPPVVIITRFHPNM